jgi:WD40 repeat protein
MTHMIINGAKDGVDCLLVVDSENKAVHPSFKDCQPSGTGAVCLVSGGSSFSGVGSQGDILITAQKNSASIHIYQWNKPQSHVHCRIQEVLVSLACDPMGMYLIGGTKKGWLYCWELGTGKLLNFWQGHFKPVRRICVTQDKSPFVLTVSEDGIAKAWDLSDILVSVSSTSGGGSAPVQAFKVWTHHSQAITDMAVASTGITTRILTCSLDRMLVIQDLHVTRKSHSILFPEPLESVVCSPGGELAFLGASNGHIYVVNLSATAIMKSGGNDDGDKSTMVGHSRAVVSMALSHDMRTLISGSDDGTIRMWDVDTKQCLNVIHSARGVAVKTILSVVKSDLDTDNVQSPFLTPIGHIRKFADTDDDCTANIAPMLLAGGNNNVGDVVVAKRQRI